MLVQLVIAISIPNNRPRDNPLRYHDTYIHHLLWDDGAAPRPSSLGDEVEEVVHVTDREEAWQPTLCEAELSFELAGPDELAVEMDTVTPNFDRFEVKLDVEGGFTPAPASGPVTWRLHEGLNSIMARTVNRLGRRGAVSWVATD